MQKRRKKEATKPVKPSQSGRKRGEKEESKLPKIITTIGVGILVALVLALIVALIIVSVSQKNEKKNPFEDIPHLNYEQVQLVVDGDIPALNQNEDTVDTYVELIKDKTFIVFYRNEDLENKQFVDAVLQASNEKVGVVVYNLTLYPDILGEEDTVLGKIEFSDNKQLPFVFIITNHGQDIEFVGLIDDLLKALQ